MNLYGTDDYWAARRAELLRARRRRELAKLVDAVINAVLAILFVASVVGLCYLAGRETRERASYLEGRYGVDRAEAVAMAERGEGKTAREVLSTDYADFHGLEVVK